MRSPVGHSERRQYFKEDDEMLKTKLEYALSKGLKVAPKSHPLPLVFLVSFYSHYHKP